MYAARPAMATMSKEIGELPSEQGSPRSTSSGKLPEELDKAKQIVGSRI